MLPRRCGEPRRGIVPAHGGRVRVSRKQKQMGGRPGRPGPAGGRAAGGRAAVAVLRVALAAPVLNHACGGRAC
jgi:hypothetical protein